MNHSSLFTFEESSVCDPKVMRKHMVIPQDQLTKLNSLPGWAKVENYHNTLRLDKDFSVENSQSKCSIDATQSNQIIEKNTVLFDEQIENRKKILKSYKVYGEKLTRSSSLFNIDENCENLSNIKTLKRTLSLQSLCQSPDASDLNIFEELRCKRSSERPYANKNVENIILTNQCETFLSESEKKRELLFEKEVTSKSMEEPQVIMPALVENRNSQIENTKELLFEKEVTSKSMEEPQVILPALVENRNPQIENTKESNGVCPTENVATGPSNVSGIHMEHVAAQSVNTDKVDLLPIVAKDSSGSLPAENVAPCSNNIPVEPAKNANDSNVDKSIKTSLNKFTESHVSVPVESFKSDARSTKEVSANVIYVSASPLEDTKPPASISNECINLDPNSVEKITPENVAASSIAVVSNDLNSHTSCPSKSVTLVSPAKELSIHKKNAISETEQLIRVPEVNDVKSDQKDDDGDKAYDPAKSTNNEASSSKKRKLESRNKRSKRLKSEEKQGNIKIRSIKKVGEVFYSVEEVKTMLDIMKQLL